MFSQGDSAFVTTVVWLGLSIYIRRNLYNSSYIYFNFQYFFLFFFLKVFLIALFGFNFFSVKLKNV